MGQQVRAHAEPSPLIPAEASVGFFDGDSPTAPNGVFLLRAWYRFRFLTLTPTGLPRQPTQHVDLQSGQILGNSPCVTTQLD